MKTYLFGFALISVMAQAQECNLKLAGQVIDFHDGTPLYNATLEVEGKQLYTVTDFEGKYTLEGLCPGDHEILVTHPECENESFPITINADSSRDFKLEHHAEELSKVTVTGQKFGQETTSSAEKSLSSELLESYSDASLGDALREISGVSSLNTGSTVVKPVIQGLHSSRVLLVSNGIRLEDQEWGVEHAPNFDVNSAGHVTVVKGAGALRYGGDAVGGVIIADSRIAPVKDTLYGKTIFNAATNGRGVGATSELTKAYATGWYLKGQGTLKYAGDLEAPDYVLSNTGVRERDFSVGFGLNKFTYGFDSFYSYYDSQIGILRASHIGSVGDLVQAINNEAPNFVEDFTYEINAPKQDVKHHLAKVSVFRRFERAGKLSLDYAFQLNNRLEFDIRRGDDRNTPSLDLELTTHSLQTNFEWDAKADFTANFGLAVSYQKNFPDPDTGIRRLIPDYEQETAAGYATMDYTLSDTWKMDGGVRYDYSRIDAKKFYRLSRWEERGYAADFGDRVLGEFENQLLVNPIFDYHNFAATLGTAYFPNDQLTLRLNLSSASRAPNPSELFSDGLHHSAAVIELGDLRLQPEQSYKTSLEVSGDYGRFGFSFNPYYNHISDFIILEPNGIEQTTRGAFPIYEYRQVDARLWGLDVNAQYTFNDHLDLKGTFAYVNGEDLERDRPLIDMPAPNWNNTLTYRDSDWKNFRVSLRSQAVFEQTRFPDNDFLAPVLMDGELIDTNVAISKPPPAYHLLHFATGLDFNLSEKSKLGLSIFIDNLLDTEYRDYLNRQRYFVDDLGRNFRVQLKLNY